MVLLAKGSVYDKGAVVFLRLLSEYTTNTCHPRRFDLICSPFYIEILYECTVQTLNLGPADQRLADRNPWRTLGFLILRIDTNTGREQRYPECRG